MSLNMARIAEAADDLEDARHFGDVLRWRKELREGLAGLDRQSARWLVDSY